MSTGVACPLGCPAHAFTAEHLGVLAGHLVMHHQRNGSDALAKARAAFDVKPPTSPHQTTTRTPEAEGESQRSEKAGRHAGDERGGDDPARASGGTRGRRGPASPSPSHKTPEQWAREALESAVAFGGMEAAIAWVIRKALAAELAAVHRA
jgi:hypothetical protein